MKKLFSLLLVLTMCFILVGCSSNDDNDSSETKESTKTEEKKEELITYADEEKFSEAYPILSDTVYLKNLDFKNALKYMNVIIPNEAGLEYLSAYEKDNDVNVTYIINDDISYRLIFNKNTFELNGVDVTTSNGRENEKAIALGIISIINENETFDDEEIKSFGAALQSDESNVYSDKDDKYTISVTKSEDVCSYRVTKNK